MEEIVIDLPGVIHASWEDGESFPVRDGAPTKGNDALMFAVRTASRLFSAYTEVVPRVRRKHAGRTRKTSVHVSVRSLIASPPKKGRTEIRAPGGGFEGSGDNKLGARGENCVNRYLFSPTQQALSMPKWTQRHMRRYGAREKRRIKAMDMQALVGIEAAAQKLKALKEREAALMEERAELIEEAVKVKARKKDIAAAAGVSVETLRLIRAKRKREKSE